MTVFEMPAWSSGNAYNHLLCDALKAQGLEVREWKRRAAFRVRAGDVVHVHWPATALRRRWWPIAVAAVGLTLASFMLARFRGAVVVYTLHNLANHDPRYLRTEFFFWRFWTWVIDGWIALSHSSADVGMDVYPALRRKPLLVSAQGPYSYPNRLTRSEARRRLGLSDGGRVLVFIGRIVPYKGVSSLVDAFRGWGQARDRLLVAGAVEGEFRSDVLSWNIKDARVVVRGEFVPDDELQVYMNAADMVVAPYEDVFSSSTVMLALSYERPVMVPDKVSFAELAKAVGDGWIRLYEPPLRSEDLDRVHEGVPQRSPDLRALAWDAIARETAEFFSAVAGPTRD